MTFETALGPVTLEWSARGLAGCRLGGGAPSRGAAPPWIAALAARIERHMGGAPQDFSDVPLDLAGAPTFRARVWQALREIGPGRTVTYGELAARAGRPGAARAVGDAMRKNPLLLVVPCHRVVAAGGALGGFSAPGGARTKRAMLALERGAAADFAPAAGAHNLPFDADRAARELARRDPALGALIERVGAVRLRIDPAAEPFDMLAKSILHQQLAGAAARTIHGRFLALVGADEPARRLMETPDAKVRACGVSGPKLRALRDLAARTLAGELPTRARLEAMDDDAIVRALTVVRGIGAWTVHMLLIFRLGRPDVWPADDYGVRKAWAKVHRKRALPTPRQLERAGERLRPFRSVASWYLWRALD